MAKEGGAVPQNGKSHLGRMSHDLAAAKASRAALRVLPLVIADAEFRQISTVRLQISVFRAIAIARAIRMYPTPGPQGPEAASRAGQAILAANHMLLNYSGKDGEFDRLIHLSGTARLAALAAADPEAAPTHAASARSRAYNESRFWGTFETDVRDDDELVDAVSLLKRPLWGGDLPDDIAQAWTSFVSNAANQEKWAPWIHWYNLKLKGSDHEWGVRFDQEQEFARRLIDASEDFWKRGEVDPAYVSVQLNQWYAELSDGPGVLGAAQETSHSIDFFISYTEADEAMARETVDVLEEAGFTTFVQFRDMPPGSNFPIEMNKGLSASKAFIALYSEAYFESKHCRAEFAFAYNQDPDGAKRFLRALYLAPCEVPPLARQIVYHRLIGLDAPTRKAEILDLARYEQQRTSAEETLEFARKIFSPKPTWTEACKIGVASNPDYDQPVAPQDCLDSIRQMLMLLKALRSHLSNAPGLIATNLKHYEEELSTHGAMACWGGLDRLMRHAETAFRAADPREFDPGVAEQFEDVLGLHARCMTELPNADERFNRLADTRVDESATGPAIIEPIKAIKQAAEALQEAGLTEESFDQVAEEIVRNGLEIAFQREPCALPMIDPDDPSALEHVLAPAVSSKKAGILGALGFAKESYNLLGATASLAPVYFQVMTYLQAAIQALMALLR